MSDTVSHTYAQKTQKCDTNTQNNHTVYTRALEDATHTKTRHRHKQCHTQYHTRTYAECDTQIHTHTHTYTHTHIHTPPRDNQRMTARMPATTCKVEGESLARQHQYFRYRSSDKRRCHIRRGTTAGRQAVSKRQRHYPKEQRCHCPNMSHVIGSRRRPPPLVEPVEALACRLRRGGLRLGMRTMRHAGALGIASSGSTPNQR
jgi:hypothetical protein